MKTLYCTYLAFWLLAISCENPSRTGMTQMPDIDTTDLWTERATFETEYDPKDSMYGHPGFFCYIPGEQRIPYDTLANTHIFGSVLIGDVRGFGLLSSVDFAKDFQGTGFVLNGFRIGRGEKGVLEFGRQHRNGITNGLYYASVYNGFLENNLFMYGSYGQNTPTRQKLNDGKEEAFRNSLGRWYQVYFSNDIINLLSRQVLLDPTIKSLVEEIQLPVYYPRLLDLKPTSSINDVNYIHSRNKPIVLSWQSDPNSPNKKIVISVSNYNNTLPKEFGFNYQYDRFGKEQDYDVNKPPGVGNYASGPGPFFIGDFRRFSTPAPHLEWSIEIEEKDGLNTVEIPAEVWSLLKVNPIDYIHIRGYRWFDVITYFDNQYWISNTRDKARCHYRVVSTSYGAIHVGD